MQHYRIKKKEWDTELGKLLLSHFIFAPLKNESGQDYEMIGKSEIPIIHYSTPKPLTPLKYFFLPFRENVTDFKPVIKPSIILGAPNCDIEALNLLDAIYPDDDFPDIFYREKRDSSILVSFDCLDIREHCHCLSYGIKPYADSVADLSVNLIDDEIIIREISIKGKELIGKISHAAACSDESIIAELERRHANAESGLRRMNPELPGYEKTGSLIKAADKKTWKKHSSKCVSCGACAAICPTCSCFLLVDLPGFGKIKQLDSCQYPGFERVAGGEDPLFGLHNRFMNRYSCKYLWKYAKFGQKACTGCGRCIAACIGRISKNEVIKDLA